MAMGRPLRVYHNLPQVGVHAAYSLVMEQKNRDEILLVENYAIVALGVREFEALKKDYVKHTDAFGSLGILRVSDGSPGIGEHVLYFLVLVTGCVSAGKIGTSEIYRVTNVVMISMRNLPQDEEKVTEIKKLLCCGAFYFAWSHHDTPIDLTLSTQKAVKFAKTDNRFFWNRMCHIPFIRHGINCQDWLLKVMCGSVEIRTVYVGSRQAKAVVISRLSSERAGTRFQVRGVDDQGHVANFAETEQMIVVGEDISSFLQIRGSVPLFWDQPGINVGSHKIRMSRGPELSTTAFDLHLTTLKQNYGHQAIVNLLGSSLVGSKEGEATLSTAFQTHQKLCEQHLDVPHILFDYHAEVKGGSIKNLSRLHEKVQQCVNKFGFFTKVGPNVSREQYGTVRTNCTDCLDRTNAVQAFLGNQILAYQLQDLQLDDKSNIVSRFEEMFKQMWQNNGNELSKMYAGTGALGGGTSKIIDGARSAARTIQNNLLDQSKQEAIDVLLFGSSFNSDLADRARVLLPSHYINAPRPVLESLVHRYLSYSEPVPLRVGVGTYNINGGKHFRSIVYKDVSLSDWLLDAHKTVKESDLSECSTDEKKPIDIYAIGFEEMVDLDAKNIMNASSENAKSWASELTKTLNRDEKFSLITYQQLVGVCLYVFVRPELAPHIQDVAVDCVKTGMGGATGNKGAVAIRLRYHSTSICFVCSHFAAGQGNITDRNNDFNEAVKRIIFPKGRTLMSHDYVFWCGDFNYRINMAREDVKALVANEDWETLLSADQLKIEHGEGNVFQGFIEGPVNFPPTYKYDLFSDDYDTSEKCRVPAWTDRILWRRRQLSRVPPEGWSAGQCHWYGRANLKQSDHRPVLAILDVEALKVNVEKREAIFEDALKDVGPPDGSVLLQFENVVSFDLQNVIDDHFMDELHEELGKVGPIRFTKYINEMIWVAFMNHSHALDAEKVHQISVCGHEITIRLKHPNWRELLEQELELCSSNTIPLCGTKELNMRKESARMLSQLSQLSFEELEDITMTVSNQDPSVETPATVPPARPRPPPPRPAPPPGRPAQPPSRPSAPPARPAPPPERPKPPGRPEAPKSASASPQPPRKPPPPMMPPKQAVEDQDTRMEEPLARPPNFVREISQTPSEKAGFSDIFTVTSPVTADLPISSSTGSIVALTMDPSSGTTTKSSSSTTSLEYPEGYDPVIESGKAWSNGQEQTIPGQDKPTDLPVVRQLPKLPPRQSSSESGKSTPSGSTPGSPFKLAPKKGGAPPPAPPPRVPPTLPGRPPASAGRAPPPIPKR
ncbi:synaptojanin-1-like isoform X2 [Tigriopus californicus]|uniref:synaptojanin-1-like isoform X2 n=1 Tax=Tigriopus californicus TaxID=6832 RepID=UPI0027DA0677|nr:synaptojanin-1-like isoform X2 [Tigriopus californicus]